MYWAAETLDHTYLVSETSDRRPRIGEYLVSAVPWIGYLFSRYLTRIGSGTYLTRVRRLATLNGDLWILVGSPPEAKHTLV